MEGKKRANSFHSETEYAKCIKHTNIINQCNGGERKINLVANPAAPSLEIQIHFLNLARPEIIF